MIGIGLISLFSVIIASVKATAHDQITHRYPVDYAISGLSYDDGRRSALPRTLASALRARPELAAVAEVRTIDVTVDGHPAHFAAVDPAALGTLVRPHGYEQLTDNTVIVSTSLYASPNAHPASVTTGSSEPLRIIGVTDLALPGTGRIDALVTWDRLTTLGAGDADAAVLAKAAPHMPPTASRDAVDQATADYPLAQVNSVADLTSSLNSAVDGLIALFAGLVATAVLIALSGIANTLSLSVVERTRESATLRVLGLTRRQLGSTLLVEAILMAVAGAIAGIGLGLAFGVLVAEKALAALQPTVAIPWAWLAALVAGAAVAGGAAAVLPARKAAQASIVTAMAEV